MDNFTDTICIVIVLYNVPLEESTSFISILGADRGRGNLYIYIHDNSKNLQKVNDYPGCEIKYEHDSSNPGVSKAYNRGADYAKSKKKKWLLLLDQDTTLPNEIFAAYKNSVAKYKDIKLFAPILKLGDQKLFSPCRYAYKRGFHLYEIAPGLASLHKLAPVNSGMLIDVAAFFEVGGYNNKVKLDFSDFQFVERFRKKYPQFCVVDITCQQDFSDDQPDAHGQLARFTYYCDGALNITKENILDWLHYYGIVMVRAVRLSFRHKSLRFIVEYLKRFFIRPIIGKESTLLTVSLIWANQFFGL